MKEDNLLSAIENSIEKEMKENYIVNYATLVADNIATYYKYLGNKINIPLKNIMRMSEDDYLIDENLNDLNFLIDDVLKRKYNLKIINNQENEILILEELK